MSCNRLASVASIPSASLKTAVTGVKTYWQINETTKLIVPDLCFIYFLIKVDLFNDFFMNDSSSVVSEILFGI